MMKTIPLAVLAVGLTLAAGAAAQEPENAAVIKEVQVVGTVTVGRSQVLAWSGFEEGKSLTRESVATGIRRLFATQKFSDIYVYEQDIEGGVRLIVNLQEFPRIRTITFGGNKKVNKDDLQEALPLTVGQFANPAVIDRELEGIKDLYREKGYYNVAVNTDSSRVDQTNMEDLIVTVVEGRKVKARTITFTGLDKIKPGDLRGVMKQSTGGFLKSATFKQQQFDEDKERIIAFCRDKGYLDASIEDTELNLRENREGMDIVIHMTEGPVYTVGDINWENNTVCDDVEIADRIQLEKGKVFSEGDYHLTLQALHTMYADRGYIYNTVEPVRDIEGTVVNVTFVFREGDPARIRDIRIVDNLKTYDSVILREMAIFPGDLFSSDKLQYSQQRIFQLGYFEDVQPDFRQVNEAGDIDLIMKVKERQTGQFMFGMAYSVQTSATGFIQVAETNFRGKGQNIGVTWQFGSRRRYVDISFTEPWFRGTPTTVGLDLFDRYQYNYDDFYESRIRGFSARLGRRIPGTRYTSVGLRYELSNTELSNFSTSYVQYLNDLENQLGTSDLPWERLDKVDWPRSKSALRLTFTRDSTDNPLFPTHGSKTQYSVELSGGPLGADISYQEHMFTHSYYQRLPAHFALHVRSFLGLIEGLDSPGDVPDYEKFRLGGNRVYPLRGYKDLEVVPRGNPGFIGGRFFTIFNLEVLYPLTKSIQLLSFLDQGDTWNSLGEADFTNLRKGAGFGVRVEVPMMGTIGFDYGYGFDREGGPSWEPHFNIGSFF